MNGQGEEGGGLYRLNYPGLIAGIALVILPFLGAWWVFSFGTDAVVIALSPFHVMVQSFGNEISTPLATSLNIGLKIVFIYYGVLLIAGSMLRTRDDRRSTSDILVRVSARKFIWLVVLFVLSVAAMDFIINQAFALTGVHAQVPYFAGESQVALQVAGVSMTLPVIQGFTGMFAVAVLVALLSLVASFYQGHLTLVKTVKGPRFRRIPGEPPAATGETQPPAGTEDRGR
jgi:hypothetical protein